MILSGKKAKIKVEDSDKLEDVIIIDLSLAKNDEESDCYLVLKQDGTTVYRVTCDVIIDPIDAKELFEGKCKSEKNIIGKRVVIDKEEYTIVSQPYLKEFENYTSLSIKTCFLAESISGEVSEKWLDAVDKWL